MLGGGLIDYLLFQALAVDYFAIFILIGAPIALISLSLAFFKIQEQPLSHFISVGLIYLTKPKQRLWKRQTNYKPILTAPPAKTKPETIIAPKRHLEKSELERDIAASKLNFSVANMKMAEIDLKACRLVAPFPGRLIKKLVQEHEFVRASQQVINIIDDYQLLAVMHLPSSEINKVAIGKRMRVWIDETRTEHEGTVNVISGEIDPGSRTFEIKVLIDNRDRKLAAGMSGKLMKQYDKDSGKK